MNKEEQLRIVVITLIICCICVVIFEVFNIKILTLHWIRSMFSISTVLTFWWGFYFKYGWRIPILNCILKKEDINGTWFGKYESKRLIDNAIFTGEISLVIKQSYLNIDITSYTEKYTSYSYSEVLAKEKKSERNELIYVYSQKQLSSYDHNIRKGTSELELTINKAKAELYGKFWTNSASVGHLKVKRVSKNHIVFFEDAKLKFKEGENQ